MAKDHKPERVALYEKLQDLQSWEMLFAVCSCGRVREMDKTELIRKHAGATIMRSLEPRLRCDVVNGCGKRGLAMFLVKKMPRSEDDE